MPKKSFYTKRLGMKVANDAQPALTGHYHVISSESSKWTVVSDGKIRPIKVFMTQKDAINFATSRTASLRTGIVFIHGKTGKVRDKISFAL